MRSLKHNVTATWGEQGRIWLSELPATLEALSREWALSDIKPIEQMSYNFVALAIQNNHYPVALKISCDHQLIADEYNALKHFNGHGAINVLARNLQYNALLLQQAIPGNLLINTLSHDTDSAIKQYAKVITCIRNIPLDNNTYPLASHWCHAIDRINDPRVSQYLIDKAKAVRDYLINTSVDEYLCHGDLHLENIIQHKEQWLAIDPKGVIGDVAFEAAAFDFISASDYQDGDLITEKFSARSKQLATTLNIDIDRLVLWAFLRTIISAQWFIEDNGDPSSRIVLARHIFEIVQAIV